MFTCSLKESLAAISQNKSDWPCILRKSDVRRRLSIAILSSLSARASRAASRALVLNHLKLALWSSLKASFTAWTTLVDIVESLYRFIAVVKSPGFLDRSRSHKKNECSAMIMSADCHMSWVDISGMPSLTYTEARNILLNRLSTNLLPYENQIQAMNNPWPKTHQGKKARLYFLRGNERRLQSHRKCRGEQMLQVT
jgi:hypothetical protein